MRRVLSLLPWYVRYPGLILLCALLINAIQVNSEEVLPKTATALLQFTAKTIFQAGTKVVEAAIDIVREAIPSSSALLKESKADVSETHALAVIPSPTQADMITVVAQAADRVVHINVARERLEQLSATQAATSSVVRVSFTLDDGQQYTTLISKDMLLKALASTEQG